MNVEWRSISKPHPKTGVPARACVQVEGTDRKNITVFYDGWCHTDAFDYRPDQDGYMMGMAHQLLWEMMSGRAPNAKPAVCPI